MTLIPKDIYGNPINKDTKYITVEGKYFPVHQDIKPAFDIGTEIRIKSSTEYSTYPFKGGEIVVLSGYNPAYELWEVVHEGEEWLISEEDFEIVP